MQSQYDNLLYILFQLAQIYRRDGPQAIEIHVEQPETSSILKMYSDAAGSSQRVLEAICDTFKIVLSYDVQQEQVKMLFGQDISEPALPDSIEMELVNAYFQMLIFGAPPLVCVEASRRQIPHSQRPTFLDLDKITKKAKAQSAEVKFDRFKLLRAEAEQYARMLRDRKVKPSFEFAAFLRESDAKKVIREVTNDKLLLAVKNTHPGVRAGLFLGLTERSIEMMLENLAHMTTVREADENAARNEIFNAMVRLSRDGHILIPVELLKPRRQIIKKYIFPWLRKD